MKLLQLALCLAGLSSSCALPLAGQYRVGIDGSIAMDRLERMNEDLQIADPEQRLDLLKRLGIDAEVARAVTSPRTGTDISIQPLRTHSGGAYGIISLPCGVQGQAFLYLLQRSSAGAWHTVDSIPLDCFSTVPAHRLISISPDEDAVFIQRANAGHGSDGVQHRSTIYTIRNGTMHEVLSTIDYRLQKEFRDDSPPTEQSSSFLQISLRAIEETRITSKRGVPLRAERRLWRWQATQVTFKPTRFVAITE